MRNQPSARWSLISSAAAHAALALWLVYGHSIAPAIHIRASGVRAGSAISLFYTPAGSSAPAAQPFAPTHPKRTGKTVPTLARIKTLAPPAKTSSTSHETGNSPLGDGDVTAASMRYFPEPEPDLSTLPHATDGNVVIEVVIDAGGRIAHETLLQGVGGSVDQSVLAGVGNWTFSPATRNGVAVASTQQIIFHYERA